MSVLLAVTGVFATAATANAVVVYDNIPSPLAGNYPSQPFQAQQADEYGGQIQLAGTLRADPTVTVTMSSWGCQSIVSGDCVTSPGATFTHPITLKVYNALPDGNVGSLVTSVTQTKTIPFRPTKTPGCPPSSHPNGAWSTNPAAPSAANCFSGFATNISFALPGVTLPNNPIVSLAYNTSNYGAAPMGTQACSGTAQGCPYDSLNVALTSPPSVGTTPRPNDGYFDTATAGNYCDGGTGGVGTFRLDAGCWNTGNPDFTPYQPALEVDVPGPATTPAGGVAGATGGNAEELQACIKQAKKKFKKSNKSDLDRTKKKNRIERCRVKFG